MLFRSLSDHLATAVYRIMQEALTNALRHAQASQIDMTVQRQDHHLCLDIQDNGNGPSADWENSGHFGVVGMRERAHALGGQLAFVALSPRGARVHAVLPLSHNPPHDL